MAAILLSTGQRLNNPGAASLASCHLFGNNVSLTLRLRSGQQQGRLGYIPALGQVHSMPLLETGWSHW